MINLSPIDRRIRETLHGRVQALSKSGNVSINETMSDSSIAPMASSHTFSTWIRMSSVVGEGKVMMGGELTESDGFISKFRDLYHQPTSQGASSNAYRPIAGIKDASCEYKGPMSALRKATINWTCWDKLDISDMEKYFLTIGKGVVLEYGWSTLDQLIGIDGSLSLFGSDEIKNGKAYNSIQDRIFNNGGNYDAMAGIITNFSWSNRDDGGFDCTTDITSMGVSIISQQAKPHSDIGIKKKPDDPKKVIPVLTLGGFVSQIDKWMKDTFSGIDTDDLFSNKKDKLQVDGGIYFRHKGDWLWGDSTYGPYISWGFMEDNILSKFLGKVKDDTIISAIRSFDEYPTNDSNKTERKSTLISNHEYLVTPDANKFILPGQLPLNQTTHEGLTNMNADVIQLPKFAKPSDKTKGFLRNIYLHWELVRDSFKDATTIEAGLQKLFRALNSEVPIWNFRLTFDDNNTGIMKVVDDNVTYKSIDTLIRESALQPNPIREVYTFPVWNVDGIVKSQTMTSKIPSAMAVTAMYGGNSSAPIEPNTGDPTISAYSHQRSVKNDESLHGLTMAYDVNAFGSIDLTWENFGPNKGYDVKISPDTTMKLDTDDQGSVKSNTHVSKTSAELVAKQRGQKMQWGSIIRANNNTSAGFADKARILYNNNGKIKPEHLKTMKHILTMLPDTAVWASSDPIIPIDLEIAVDGIGGIFPGNTFTSDYLPTHLEGNSLFQVSNISHAINSSEWVTTIKGMLRVGLSTSQTVRAILDDNWDNTTSGAEVYGPPHIPSEEEVLETLEKSGMSRKPGDGPMSQDETSDNVGMLLYPVLVNNTRD